MIYNCIIIRYGELTLKGKNKNDFIDCLYQNVKKCLNDFSTIIKIEKQYDRCYIHYEDENIVDDILKRLENISGISSFSLATKIDKEIEKIKKISLLQVNNNDKNYHTFKVVASRNDKTFPIISDQINREVASTILKNTDFKVDVHNPDVKIRIEIRKDGAYISTEKIEGLGGFPLGIGGKGLLMISGGIDSPVAGFLMMKKGVKIEAIHFSSPPYTSDMAVFKVKTLLKELAKIQGKIKFYNVPFTNLQLEIYKNCGDSYAITIMRRMMYRIADIIAKKNKCSCIINGESVGQVASQTLESMKVINEVSNNLIIRPLAIMDKLEIINIATKINTYATSILPYEDCCTIFDPKSPVTKPKLENCHYLESKFDYQTLISECLENITCEEISL